MLWTAQSFFPMPLSTLGVDARRFPLDGASLLLDLLGIYPDRTLTGQATTRLLQCHVNSTASPPFLCSHDDPG
jgi:hypothetical protein